MVAGIKNNEPTGIKKKCKDIYTLTRASGQLMPACIDSLVNVIHNLVRQLKTIHIIDILDILLMWQVLQAKSGRPHLLLICWTLGTYRLRQEA